MKERRSWFLIVVLLSIATVCFAPAVMSDSPHSDEKEINQYRLTDQKLAQFAEATKNLVLVVEKNPQLKEEWEDLGDTDDPESLSEIVAEFDQSPEAKKAVQDAGMTTREYATFEFAMLYAATADFLQKSGATVPAEYSRENMEFYRTHQADFMKLEKDLKALGQLTDEDDDDEDEDENE